jgi:hypothetical protein
VLIGELREQSFAETGGMSGISVSHLGDVLYGPRRGGNEDIHHLASREERKARSLRCLGSEILQMRLGDVVEAVLSHKQGSEFEQLRADLVCSSDLLKVAGPLELTREA